MTIYDVLVQKEYTIYKLSKESGIAKTTLCDIFSGKSNLLDCRLRIILKLSEILNISIDDMVSLQPILYNDLYEEHVPAFLYEDLKLVKDKRNRNKTVYDCYLCQLNSSINVCEVENLISTEQAEYLRNKYLG